MLTGALRQLFALSEAYPNLKASDMAHNKPGNDLNEKLPIMLVIGTRPLRSTSAPGDRSAGI
jgi:hypothetical protein